MSSFDPFLNLEKPAAADETWKAALDGWADLLSLAIHPERVMFVSSGWTSGALYPSGTPSDPRRFSTIQGALDAAESKGWTNSDTGCVILIAPATYSENIDIPGSVALVAWGGGAGGFYRGGAVNIAGQAGVLAPTITITPPESQSCRVALVGISIENKYAGDRTGAGEISEATPYAIRFKKQAVYGGAQNWLRMVDCHVRMQTWGIENRWTCGIRCEGWNSSRFVNCQIQSLDFGGGGGAAAWVRQLLRIEGDGTKAALCDVRYCELAQQSDPVTSGTAPIFFANNLSTIRAAFSAWNLVVATPSFVNGGTSSNNFAGISSAADVAAYRNIEGLALVQM